MKWFAYCCALLVAILSGACSDRGEQTVLQKDWYYEGEFAGSPGLTASPDKTVLLNLVRNETATAPLSHTIPYRYDSGGSYTYCIDEDEQYITGMKLTDAAGKQVLSLARGECGIAEPAAGNHTLSVYHDALSVPPEGTVAFVYAPRAETGSTNASATLKGGTNSPPEFPEFRALKVANNYGNDQSIRGYNLIFVPPDGSRTPEGYNYGMLRVMDPADATARIKMMSGLHLFSFQRMDTYTYRMKVMASSFDNSAMHDAMFKCSEHPDYCVNSQQGYPNTVTMPVWARDKAGVFELHVQFAGPYACAGAPASDGCYGFYRDGIGQQYFMEKQTGLLYQQLYATYSKYMTYYYSDQSFRAFRDAADMPSPPQENEAALYERANYSGKVFLPNSDFSEMSPVTPQSGIKSIKPGYNTTVLLYPEKNFQGTPTVIATNRSTLPERLVNARSIALKKSRTVLISSRRCVGCNLAMVDLNGLDLKGVDLSRAILSGANLSYANLEGANLCQAFLNGDPEMSRNQSAMLQGAYLKNANLSNANIGGADFSYAGFHSSTPGSCPQSCSGGQGCASAYNAVMTSTKFTRAYLGGTDFSSAIAQGTDFQGAVLVGANFTDTKLGADANTGRITTFSGAFLQGATFRGVATGGVNYTSAYVDISSSQANSIYFLLSGDYTRFAGYWKKKNAELCVKFPYPSKTVLPPTDSSNLCPDSRMGACTEAQWKSPYITMDKALPKASYGTDSRKVCSDPDNTW